ncbi:MAG: hypothetical protein MUE58_11165 [Chitinophagaceae bacterium]|jgi:hypothetical protein|nr:hypothetical protein [Chitinophagaceae bacterium]
MGNKILYTFLFLLPFMAGAQPWQSFEITVNGDTINRVDQGKLKQGPWVIRVESLRGEPGFEEEGYFSDDKKEGAWRKYNLQGDLIAVENFRWGNRDGKQQYFTMMGELLREESWKSVNPENPYDTIDVPDLNNPMVTVSKVIKHETSELRHGTWKFYDPTSGMIIKTENYLFGQKDKGLGSSTGSTDDLSAEQAKPTPKPKAVEDWEKKNSGKKKIVVRDGRTGG